MIRLVPAHPDALPFPAFAVHAATEIRQINHDQLSVELVEPDSMPAVVRIVWPPQPTVCDTKRFPDTAATIAHLFARAHIVLASLKAKEATVSAAEPPATTHENCKDDDPRRGNNNQMSQPYQPPTQPYPPGQPPAPPQPEPKKSWIKRKLGWLPLTVVLVLASCGVIVTAMGSSDDSTDTSAIEATSTDPTPSEKSEPEPEASQVPTVEIGEKVRDEGYQFTVTKVTCGVKRVGSSYLGEKAQGQFCLVNMRVKNISKEPINFSDENQALVDTKGREYSPDDEAWIYIDDSDPFAEINPGNTLRTTVPFDVSKHARPDYLLLKAGVWGFSDGVRVKL